MLQFNSDYLAKSILSHYFSGIFPTETEYKILMQIEFLEVLRKNIEENDIDRLFTVIREQHGYIAAIGVDLLKKYSKNNLVARSLMDMWNDSDEYLKCHLFWRILDDSDLSDSWHTKLYDFTKDNWEVFKKVQRIYWGSSSKVIPGVLKKLISHEYPVSKKWANLVRLPELADDQLFAKSIIELFKNSFNEHFKSVANDILNKYYANSSDIGINIEWQTQVTDIQSEGLEYIANALLEFYLSRNLPTLNESEKLIQQPLVKICRKIVQEIHLPSLKKIVIKENGHESALGVSFLRYYSTHQDIAELFKEKWDEADDYLKCHLFWRILDDPDLPQKWHMKLFNFIWEKWDVFKNVQKLFWGEEKDIIPGVLQRLGDATFPESKKWAYLCCLPEVADNQNVSKYIISLFKEHPDSFMKVVSNKLINRFY